MMVQSQPLLTIALTLSLMLSPSVSDAQDVAPERPSATRLESGAGSANEARTLDDDEQVAYWSILLRPLLDSNSSKIMLRRLIPLIQHGTRAEIDAHLVDAIDTGLAASLIFDRSQDPSLLKFLLQMAGNRDLDVPTQPPVPDAAQSTRIEALEGALRQADERANEARRELEMTQDRLAQAIADNKRSLDLQAFLASAQMRADSLRLELAQALARLDALERERQFMPSTLSFQLPLVLDRGFPEPVDGSGDPSDDRTAVDPLVVDPQVAIADPMQNLRELERPRLTAGDKKAPLPAKKVRVLASRATTFSSDVQDNRRKVGLKTVPTSRGNETAPRARSVSLPSVLRPDGISW